MLKKTAVCSIIYQGGKYMFNRKKYMKQYYIDNKESLVEYMKQWNIDNKKERTEQQKQYYIDNKKCKKEYGIQYYINNKEHKKEYQKQYRKDNPEQQKQWYEKNREKINEYYNKYSKRKRKTNLTYRLRHGISSSINCALKGNKAGRHWETLVDYTLNNLIKHLKKTMPKGFCWEDYMNGRLHIDHIIPASAFNFTKVEHADFKKCWGLNNLQLLPARENIRKSNHLTKPFQPALKI